MLQHTAPIASGFGRAFSEEVRLPSQQPGHLAARQLSDPTKQKAALPAEHMPIGESRTAQTPPREQVRQPIRVPTHGRSWPRWVLLVEDDRTVRVLLGRQLKKCFGVDVETAADGHHSLEAFNTAQLAELPFDLVVTDMSMPTMNGDKMSEHIRMLCPHILRPVIIAVTGNVLADDTRELLRSGVDEVLYKPTTGAQARAAAMRFMDK